MDIITRSPVKIIPTIERNSLWKDEVLDITYRVLIKHGTDVSVRCIGPTGKVWTDRMPLECFATELTLVN